jgi:hypothetical protein
VTIALAQAIPSIASTASGSSLASTALGSNPTVGNYLVMWGWGWASNTTASTITGTFSVTDTGTTNTWTLYKQAQANDVWVVCGWTKLVASGATFKVTMNNMPTSSSGNIIIAELSGVQAATPVDGTPTGTTGTSTAVAPGSMAITAGSFVGSVSSDGNSTYGGSTPAGFTRAGFQNNGSSNQVGEGIYAINLASPSNPSRTVTSAKWAAQQFALLAAAAAFTPPAPYLVSQAVKRGAYY